MTSKRKHFTAQAGRKAALNRLQQRRNRGETVGRIHLLPELKAPDLDALFAMAFPNANGEPWTI